MPDSGDNGPSHLGRMTNRRKASPAIETATRDGEDGREVEIERPEHSAPIQKPEAQAFGEMVDGDQRENAKSPEHQRVRDARQRALGNHFPLQHHFPDEIGDAARHWLEVKIGVLLGLPDDAPDSSKSPPKTKNGSCQQDEEQRPTPAR